MVRTRGRSGGRRDDPRRLLHHLRGRSGLLHWQGRLPGPPSPPSSSRLSRPRRPYRLRSGRNVRRLVSNVSKTRRASRGRLPQTLRRRRPPRRNSKRLRAGPRQFGVEQAEAVGSRGALGPLPRPILRGAPAVTYPRAHPRGRDERKQHSSVAPRSAAEGLRGSCSASFDERSVRSLRQEEEPG